MCLIITVLFKGGNIVEREQGTMFGRVLRKKWKRNFITKL